MDGIFVGMYWYSFVSVLYHQHRRRSFTSFVLSNFDIHTHFMVLCPSVSAATCGNVRPNPNECLNESNNSEHMLYILPSTSVYIIISTLLTVSFHRPLSVSSAPYTYYTSTYFPYVTFDCTKYTIKWLSREWCETRW